MSNKIRELQIQIKTGSVTRDSKIGGPGKSAGQYHVVQKGETLYSISKQHGLTVEQLRGFNKLDKDSLLQPGQKLSLK